MAALSYFAKKAQKEKKIVNLLFNTHTAQHNCIVNNPKRRYSKQLQEWVDVSTPQVISDYNASHIFIDALKNQVSRSRNVLRARKAWRSRLNNWMNLLWADSYQYFKMVYSLSQMSLAEYTIRMIRQLHHRKKYNLAIHPPEAKSVTLHELTEAPTSRRCLWCSKSARLHCTICAEQPHLHHLEYNLMYHNRTLVINR